MRWLNWVLAVLFWWLIEKLCLPHFTLFIVFIVIPDDAQIDLELYTLPNFLNQLLYNLTLLFFYHCCANYCICQIGCYQQIALHENKNFRLTKKNRKDRKDRKDHILISFFRFPFHGNIIFSEFSFRRKCNKAASFPKFVFLSKYEIFVYDSCA